MLAVCRYLGQLVDVLLAKRASLRPIQHLTIRRRVARDLQLHGHRQCRFHRQRLRNTWPNKTRDAGPCGARRDPPIDGGIPAPSDAHVHCRSIRPDSCLGCEFSPPVGVVGRRRPRTASGWLLSAEQRRLACCLHQFPRELHRQRQLVAALPLRTRARALRGADAKARPQDQPAKDHEGKILNLDGQRVACSRDAKGKVRLVSAVCTHLGCLVRWNGTERTWDCPCHGSRFHPDGAVLAGPAEAPLEKVKKPPAKAQASAQSEKPRRRGSASPSTGR